MITARRIGLVLRTTGALLCSERCGRCWQTTSHPLECLWSDYTYQLIRNLVAPAKPVDKSFRELVTLVKYHHTPPPSVTVQRFNFNSRSQKDGETVAQFVAELRRLSEHCIPRQVGRHATRSPSMRHQRFAVAATPVRDRPHFQERV